jgi:hypothetical protein
MLTYLPKIPARRSWSLSVGNYPRTVRLHLEGPDADEAPLQLRHSKLVIWQIRTKGRKDHIGIYELQCQPSEDLLAAFIHLVEFFLESTSSTKCYQPSLPSVKCNIRNKMAILTTRVSPFRMYVPLSKVNNL